MTCVNVATTYLNIGGLSADKWRVIAPLVSTSDIYALAETWHMLPDLQHPQLLTASRPPTHLRTVGHQNGGILCFVSDRIRPMIHSLHTTEYSIRFNILAHTVLIVYLPPSMDKYAFLGQLSPPQTPLSLIIGDINTRLGRVYGNDRSGPPDRVDSVRLVSQLNGLTPLAPSPLCRHLYDRIIISC